MKKHSIVIADDHPIIRKAVKRFLLKTASFEVVGEADNGLNLIKIAKQIRPDVAILDLEMPTLNGYETIKKLRKSSPEIKTIAFSGFLTRANQKRAIEAGADATLSKTQSMECLTDALRAVMGGKAYHPEIAAHEYEMPQKDQKDHSLTLREKQILTMIAQGKTSRQISSDCNISKWTVDKHRANIKVKLGLNTLAEMVRYALDQGYLDGYLNQEI